VTTTHFYAATPASTHDDELFAQAFPEPEPPRRSLFELMAEHYGYNLSDNDDANEADSLYEHILSKDD
jgi:hypothetical protein